MTTGGIEETLEELLELEDELEEELLEEEDALEEFEVAEEDELEVALLDVEEEPLSEEEVPCEDSAEEEILLDDEFVSEETMVPEETATELETALLSESDASELETEMCPQAAKVKRGRPESANKIRLFIRQSSFDIFTQEFQRRRTSGVTSGGISGDSSNISDQMPAFG